jgi:hypothetical protein
MRKSANTVIQCLFTDDTLAPPNEMFEDALVKLMEYVWSYGFVDICVRKVAPEGIIDTTTDVFLHTCTVKCRH